MYLKRLELQGFKSFAPRTVLEFSPGITAIVGPNGSGKSNIADAIRWVLGEQSMRQLRGKKSDDIIFVGGQGRAPMQMAEVGLILDNTAGWLPSERTEVSAARRIFRSGESEYLISGQRVRLRDLLLLLAQARIGHDSYTVIGQGLVDQALSARPEERRGLFEDAAGIRQFQAQRGDAEQKLALTQSNLARLRDILGEIAPRLGPLAEQARRAREYTTARDELRRLLRAWYSWQWGALQADVDRTQTEETALRARLEQLTAMLEAEDSRAHQSRQTREELLTQLTQLRRLRGETNGHLQALERDLAVAQERRASLDRQAADFEDDVRQQETALAAGQSQLAALAGQLEAAEQLADTLAEQLAHLDQTQHTMRQEQEREEARVRAAQRDGIQAQASLGATQSELGRLQKQLGERNRALAARQQTADALARRAETARLALEQQRATWAQSHAELEALVASRDTQARECSALQSDLENLQTEIADTQRTRGALMDHLNLLQSWHTNVEGYATAVRALLQASERERPPYIGMLARLIQADEGYETAIEAALGPYLQALVTTTIQDAVACATWLRARGAGYALILWATSADPASIASRVSPAPAHEGNTGAPRPGPREGLQPLANFVSIQPELRPLLDRLLRNVFLVESLESTLHTLSATADPGTASPASAPRPTISLVTRAGEVLHRDGWLRGGGERKIPGTQAESDAAGEGLPTANAGTTTAQSSEATPSARNSVLTHERELRRLPTEIEQVSLSLAELHTRYESAGAALANAREIARTLEMAAHEREAQAQETARALATAQRDDERLQSELQVSTALVEQLRAELAGVEQEVEATQLRTSEQETRQTEATAALHDAQELLDDILARNRSEQETSARARTALAVQRQEVKTLLQRVEQAHTQVQAATLQLESRSERLQMLLTQQTAVDQTSTELRESLAATRARVREISGEVGEREAALAHIEGLLAQADRDQAAARGEVASSESAYRLAMVEAQRARDAQDALVSQMRDELVELGQEVPEALQETDAESSALPAQPEDADPGARGTAGAHVLRLLLRATDQTAHPRRGTDTADPGEELPPAALLTAEDAAKLRRQLEQQRGRLRQLGGYDPDAPQAYEELKTRHDFLASQVRDMEEGATNLRAIIVELDATMRRQFNETFATVNLRFQRHFAVLFSGGAARLEMTAPRRHESHDDEDEDTEQSSAALAQAPAQKGLGVGGIEVFVQIPGKRVQDLSLLSGGERAMVSAALLFALLETNPPPFCLLDEVDAALDEANVVRFCEILTQLAASTQFVVITHNRVTMTHASAIYGVSMGADSVSRMLSMRLAEIPSAS